ncbi:alpha-protein kinase vwka [Anaeramoeba flamelloides]|uniref:Alpha-protein kinase vwka n=1 Tax=Anaeramoeba flamelloides TaxID=1746091 RepID=A0AAV7ZP45_9EUKA|nr:alpha-protein kinase vwka [Anaeramoeba flamelloides]
MSTPTYTYSSRESSENDSSDSEPRRTKKKNKRIPVSSSNESSDERSKKKKKKKKKKKTQKHKQSTKKKKKSSSERSKKKTKTKKKKKRISESLKKEEKKKPKKKKHQEKFVQKKTSHSKNKHNDKYKGKKKKQKQKKTHHHKDKQKGKDQEKNKQKNKSSKKQKKNKKRTDENEQPVKAHRKINTNRFSKIFEKLNINTPTSIRKEPKREVVLKKIENSIDLCFFLPTTITMSKIIENIQPQLSGIVKAILEYDKDKALRLAFVGYSTFTTYPRFQILDFLKSNSVNTLRTFLGSIKKVNIRDSATDAVSGIKKALSLSWQSEFKLIIHLTDSPPYGQHFHGSDFGDDENEDGDPDRNEISKLIDEMQTKNIHYFFCPYRNQLAVMKKKFRVCFEKRKNAPQLNSMKVKHTKKHLHALIVGCVKQIIGKIDLNEKEKDKKTKKEKGKEIKKEDENEKVKEKFLEKTNENEIVNKTYNAELYSINDEFNVGELSQTDEGICKKQQTQITIIQENKNHSNFQYYCEFSDGDGMILEGIQYRDTDRIGYVMELKMNYIAKYLAKEFNKYLPDKAIDFLNMLLYRIPEIDEEFFLLAKPKTTLKMEHFNQGNDLAINEDNTTATAFTHFSHHFMDGDFIITNFLQSEYICTAPEFYSCNKLFGVIDKGKKGIKGFFKKHICNTVCNKLNLEPIAKWQPSKDYINSSKTIKYSQPYKLVCSNQLCNRVVKVKREEYNRKIDNHYCYRCQKKFNNKK